MRAVAKRARVDVALVHYFFETKAKLFAAAVEMPAGPERLHEILAIVDKEPLGERVVRFYLDEVLSAGNPAVLALLRAAVSDPGSVPSLRSMIEQRVVESAASALSGPDARLRAELLGAVKIAAAAVARRTGGVA
jgi:AcrR family transcriptional regulator